MSWDEQAATWDDAPAVRAFAAAAYASLNRVLDGRGTGLSGRRVLDFGCGTGLLTVAMADTAREVVGFDTASAMVAVLNGKGRSNVVGRSGTLDEVGDGFDLVTCSSVCSFVDDYPGTVRALVDRLVVGGWFVQWDWEFDPRDDGGLSRDAIRAALTEAGLVDIVVETGFEEPFGRMTLDPVMGVGRRV